MAQQTMTWLVDDLDGTEADETVTFALDGKDYEIDLNHDNANQLRTVLDIYIRKGRRASAGNLQAKRAVRHTPHTGQRPTGRATITHIDDSAQVRAWAARYGVPVNERGRVNGAVRDAYLAFRRDDREPLRTLLKENNLDPAAADTDGTTISTKPEAAEPPQVDDRHRMAAKKAGTLSAAQLTRLRKAYADEHGQYFSNGKSHDATSCEALVKRGLFKTVEEGVFQITPAGRFWFDVHDISPDLS